MKITAKCSECGYGLTTATMTHSGNLAVPPCPRCLEDARDEAVGSYVENLRVSVYCSSCEENWIEDARLEDSYSRPYVEVYECPTCARDREAYDEGYNVGFGDGKTAASMEKDKSDGTDETKELRQRLSALES